MSEQATAYWGDTTVHAARRPTPARRQSRRQRRSRLFALVALVALLGVVLVVVVVVRQLAGSDGGQQPQAACHLDQCTGDPGVSGAPTTRHEVAARARAWLGDTGIRYSMADRHPGPGGWGWYRRDCSGFVSMALHLSDDGGGATTVGLAEVVTAVPVDRLRPYDLIGHLGPDSGGESGHVQLFLGWTDASHTRVRVAEQGGLRTIARWPHEATYAWPETMADGTVLRAYRYANMID